MTEPQVGNRQARSRLSGPIGKSNLKSFFKSADCESWFTPISLDLGFVREDLAEEGR